MPELAPPSPTTVPPVAPDTLPRATAEHGLGSVRPSRDYFVFAGGKGSRMEAKLGLPKHLLPPSQSRRPLLGWQLDRLSELATAQDRLTVGVGYRARRVERFLARRTDRRAVDSLRLPELDHLGRNLAHLSTRVRGAVLVIFFGDVAMTDRCYRAFDASLDRQPPSQERPLRLLVQAKPANPAYDTLMLHPTVLVPSADLPPSETPLAVSGVGRSREDHVHRLGTLAVALWRPALLSFLDCHGAPTRELDQAFGAEAGGRFSPWRCLCRAWLAEGRGVDAVLAPDPAVNVNHRRDLDRASRLLLPNGRLLPSGREGSPCIA